ncbi:hypothetical protein [Streptomyces sp. BRA346]
MEALGDVKAVEVEIGTGLVTVTTSLRQARRGARQADRQDRR